MPVLRRRTRRWEAHIWDAKKQVYLGGYDSEEHAGAVPSHSLPDTMSIHYVPLRVSRKWLCMDVKLLPVSTEGVHAAASSEVIAKCLQ